MDVGGCVRRGSSISHRLCLEPALVRSPQKESLPYSIQRLTPCFLGLELRCKAEPRDQRSYCCCHCSLRVEVGWCLLPVCMWPSFLQPWKPGLRKKKDPPSSPMDRPFFWPKITVFLVQLISISFRGSICIIWYNLVTWLKFYGSLLYTNDL